MDLQLRKSMGGYKKDDVAAYIESLVKKYEGNLEELRGELEAARTENSALTKQNTKLFEQIREMEAERDSVSRAVISAQKEAEKILTDARAEGEALLAKKEEEVAAENEKLLKVREEIRTTRLAAAAAARKYDAALSEIPGISGK